MKRTLIAATACTIVCILSVHARGPFLLVSRPLRISLPHGVDTTNLSILFCLRGPFGGYCDFVRAKAGTRDYEIDTSHEGRAAESVKVIVYCPSYQVETLDFSSLADVRERSVELQPKPLATLPFHGKVSLPARLSSDQIRVDVTYSPLWECEFFGLADCLVGGVRVASAELAEDGRFTVALPDLARDPIVGSVRNRGHLRFTASNQRSGSLLYELKPEGMSKGGGWVPVADRYPDEQGFTMAAGR